MEDKVFGFVLVDGRTIGSLLAEDKLLSEFDLGNTLEDAKYNVSKLIVSLNNINHPLSSKYSDEDFIVSLDNLEVLKLSLKDIPDKVTEITSIDEVPNELATKEELDAFSDEIQRLLDGLC